MAGSASTVEGVGDDRELLGRFVRGKDERAFAELVGRHGRMVSGACRRVLGDSPEADDALQATFLILVAHAGELHRAGGGPRSLGGWLHRVATNAALQARRESKARARRESAFARARRELRGGSPLDELLPILDDEVRRLPDRYRTPLVLCYLEDRSMQGAAAELGVSYSTLRRRLDRALELLRGRLAGRGCALAPALLGAILWDSAALAGDLEPGASAAPAGSALGPPTSASPGAVTLSRKVLRMMRNQVIRRSATLQALVLLVGSAGLVAREVLADDGPAANPPANKAVAPRAERAEAGPAPPAVAELAKQQRGEAARKGAPAGKDRAVAPRRPRAPGPGAVEPDTRELDREILDALKRGPFGGPRVGQGRNLLAGPPNFPVPPPANGPLAGPESAGAPGPMAQSRPLPPGMVPMFGFVNPAVPPRPVADDRAPARRPDPPNGQAANADRPRGDRPARPPARRAAARKKAPARAEDAARMLNMRVAPGFFGGGPPGVGPGGNRGNFAGGVPGVGPGGNGGNGVGGSFWWVHGTW